MEKATDEQISAQVRAALQDLPEKHRQVLEIVITKVAVNHKLLKI